MDEKRDAGAELMEYLKLVPDPRDRRGRRHPLAAILALLVAAMAAGARTLLAVAEWGRALQPEQAKALGFPRGRTPSVSTLHLVLKKVEPVVVERVLGQWAQAQEGPERVISVDGKGLRGIHGEELPGVRLVAAYSDRVGLVLAQEGGKGG